MKTILAGFMAFGMMFSTGIMVAGSAHAATHYYVPNRTTVTGNAAG